MAKVKLDDIHKIFSHNLLQRELINQYHNVDRRGNIKINTRAVCILQSHSRRWYLNTGVTLNLKRIIINHCIQQTNLSGNRLKSDISLKKNFRRLLIGFFS